MASTSARPPRRWLRSLLGIVASSAAVALLTLWQTSAHFAAFGGSASGTERARMQASPRYRAGRFVNLEHTGIMRAGLGKALRNWLVVNEMRVPTCALPVQPDTARRLAVPPSSGLRVTWLGHSTSLIEIDGVRILTDPIWSERASPSTLAGPRRFHRPPLAFEALPKLDAVIISHDHYDHLDMLTVQKLAARGVMFHVALGVAAHLVRWGVPWTQINEHDWWSSSRLPNGVQLVSTPARHFSGRGLTDRDTTLWTSWTLIGPTHRVFFSGDTGPTESHARIAQKFGPFDLAMLEIGQYHVSWGDIHLGPLGALEAFAALHAKKLLPIHWSTFELALHAWSEPAETISIEAAKRGVALLTPHIGEPIEPTLDPRTTAWWRALPPLAAQCP